MRVGDTRAHGPPDWDRAFLPKITRGPSKGPFIHSHCDPEIGSDNIPAVVNPRWSIALK